MGSCPGGELLWLGVALVGSCTDGELSWWGVVLVGSSPRDELHWWVVTQMSCPRTGKLYKKRSMRFN